MRYLPLLLCIGGSLHAGVIGYTSNPSGDSSDFASGVASAGGVITGPLTWEDHALGALDPNHYAGMTVLFDTTAAVSTVLSVGSPGSGPYS